MARYTIVGDRWFSHVPREVKEVDVVSNTTNPVSITSELLSNAKVQEIEIFFGVDVYATWAIDQDTANDDIEDATKRRKYLCGMIKSFYRRDDTLELYVRAKDETTLTVGGIDKEIYFQNENC